MKRKKLIFSLVLIFSVTTLLMGCKKDTSTMLKVYVRNARHQLAQDATVRIVGNSKQGTPEYLKEGKTDKEGVVLFNLSDLFLKMEGQKTAYITIYSKTNSLDYTSRSLRVIKAKSNTLTINLKK